MFQPADRFGGVKGSRPDVIFEVDMAGAGRGRDGPDCGCEDGDGEDGNGDGVEDGKGERKGFQFGPKRTDFDIAANGGRADHGTSTGENRAEQNRTAAAAAAATTTTTATTSPSLPPPKSHTHTHTTL